MTKHMKTVILFALIALFGGIIVLDISRKLRILEGVDGTDSTEAEPETAPTTDADADAKTAPTTDADAKTSPTTEPETAPTTDPETAPTTDPETAPTTDADAKTAPTTESAVEKCGESAPVSVLRYSAY